MFRRFWHWLDGIDRRVFGPAPDLSQTIQQHLTEVGSADNLTRPALPLGSVRAVKVQCPDERGRRCTLCRQLDDEAANNIRPLDVDVWEREVWSDA